MCCCFTQEYMLCCLLACLAGGLQGARMLPSVLIMSCCPMESEPQQVATSHEIGTWHFSGDEGSETPVASVMTRKGEKTCFDTEGCSMIPSQ